MADAVLTPGFEVETATSAVDAWRDSGARRAAKGGEAGGRRLAAQGRGVPHRQGDKLASESPLSLLEGCSGGRRLALAGRRPRTRCVPGHELVGRRDRLLGGRCQPRQMEHSVVRSI
jgi:hypothetical protein